MAPGKESHRYSRHLDAKLGLMDKSKYYPLSIPLNARMSASRVVENVWSQPLQDAFQKMIDAMDDVRTTLADGVAAGFFPPSYHTHPVVANAGINEIVLPLMLYVDGVPITRRDGCVGFVLRCILPPRKPYLVLVLRKEDMCKCGCRGWCTLHVVHLWLQWGFKALANGRNPAARHDGTEFGLDEAPRAAVANQEFSKGGLIIKGACILLKGDLKELSSTWGLPDTSSHDAPCGLCCKSGQDFLNFRDFSPLAMPDPPKTFDVYNSACERCEIWTPVLDWRCFWQMRGSLKQDRREQGPRGRCLIVDMPELGLLKSDRLEPSVDLSDIYVIDAYTRESYVPQSFLFWRRSEETHTRHRCILFNDAELGITLYKSLAMDFLHCVSKGVYSFFCAHFFKTIFESNVLGVEEGPYDVVVMATVQEVRSRLFQWYRDEATAGRIHTQVQQLTPSMFGSRLHPSLDLHASETNHFIQFLSTFLNQLGDRMPNHARWRSGLDPLLKISEIYAQHSYCNLPAPAIQEFCDCIISHFRACQQLEIPSKPKHHMLMEMGVRANQLGGLALNATFPDEGLNRIIKEIGQTAHRLVWSLRVLDDFDKAMTLQPTVHHASKRPRDPLA